MRLVRVPQGMRRYFSHNELSGWWADNIAYTPPAKKSKRKSKRKRKPTVIVCSKPKPPPSALTKFRAKH